MVSLSNAEITLLMECGFIYLDFGKYQQAREVFEGVAVLEPKSELPLVAMGAVFFAQYRFDQAIRVYKKALTLKPDSAFAKAYLGESLFFHGKKDEAMVELEKSSLLDPQGQAGNFARALMDAIQKGFIPPPRKAVASH